eukprot:CAMPEP_0167758466 /NCGR_PEP_ID=MMETSP0110_2-20121227/10483_1 /TAXON_ID=629695 /ORGANISM="Gymnochlora sp., Strain CCMP2014" /LENGTH=332 /DNA_ID=CAMNT_0007644743 /DNA_START=134 /DNA_END=1132 /DNA_ORIENTATION=-
MEENLSGYLKMKSNKKVMGYSQWGKYFFVLQKGTKSIQYWKKSYDTGKEPVGRIPLSVIKSVVSKTNCKAADKRLEIQVRGSDRPIQLKADSVADLKTWLLSIRAALQTTSAVHATSADWKPKKVQTLSEEEKDVIMAEQRNLEQKKTRLKEFKAQMSKHLLDSSEDLKESPESETRQRRSSLTEFMLFPEREEKKEEEQDFARAVSISAIDRMPDLADLNVSRRGTVTDSPVTASDIINRDLDDKAVIDQLFDNLNVTRDKNISFDYGHTGRPKNISFDARVFSFTRRDTRGDSLSPKARRETKSKDPSPMGRSSLNDCLHAVIDEERTSN